MFTVSCYAFHPLIQRFVRLWRYVQVVSDVITFVLSMLCCQCSDAMPLSSSSSVETKPSIQVFEGHPVNPKFPSWALDLKGSSGEPMSSKRSSADTRCPVIQHTVIDFTPGREDTPEVQKKCQEFWQSSRHRKELDAMMVGPSPKPGPSKRQLIELSRSRALVHPEIVVEQSSRNLPGIHVARKHNKSGHLKDAIQTGALNKCRT